MKHVAALSLMAVCAVVLSSQPAPRERAGRQPDGSFLLPTGWRLKPVGRQIPLDTLPMSSAVSKDEKFLLVLNGGYKPPSISVIDLAQMREISRVPVPDGWLGLAFSPDGTRVYVGGAAQSAVFEFTFSSSGELKPARTFVITPAAQRTDNDFIGDVAVSPDGKLVYAADLYHDSIVVIDLESARAVKHFKTGRRPYRILFHPDGKSLFVSSWADGSVSLYNANSGSMIGEPVRLGPHPTDMVLSDRKPEGGDNDQRYRLFVSAANTNSVFVVGIGANRELKPIETIDVAMTSLHPLGMTPSALALSPDQTKLFVVCSDANVVAAADISEARSRVTGFIPAGWYPTAARVLADNRIVVLNGRGLQSYANPKGELAAAQQTGTISVIDPLSDEALDQYTKSARSLTPYREDNLEPELQPDSVIISKPDKPSPIEHVIYIVKGGRSYDQVFGKIGKGDSDPSLDLFDESAAPNHYKLAREFVLFDNFYVNGEVSADGQNWAAAGIAPDYTQKLWPSFYGGRLKNYGFEGGEPANTPPANYLWDNAISAGVSIRSYGYWVKNKPRAGSDGVQIEQVYDPALRPVTNLRYRGFDLNYSDVNRARVFLEDMKQFEVSGSMPRFMMLRLDNDLGNGSAPDKLTPLSLFADNDYALGLIVEGVSKSPFWANTAIFVVEADAQNGPDHVDSHRSLLLVVSPYTRRGVIDSTMYNQTSVLRTIELILGMRPLTHYDAAARPLTAAFTSTPNSAPYSAGKPHVP